MGYLLYVFKELRTIYRYFWKSVSIVHIWIGIGILRPKFHFLFLRSAFLLPAFFRGKSYKRSFLRVNKFPPQNWSILFWKNQEFLLILHGKEYYRKNTFKKLYIKTVSLDNLFSLPFCVIYSFKSYISIKFWIIQNAYSTYLKKIFFALRRAMYFYTWKCKICSTKVNKKDLDLMIPIPFPKCMNNLPL